MQCCPVKTNAAHKLAAHLRQRSKWMFVAGKGTSKGTAEFVNNAG